MCCKHSTLLLLVVVALTSCKSYEVMSYKAAELDKAGDLGKYTVYLHAKGHVFQVTKPFLSKAQLTGTITVLTDQNQISAIESPKTRHDLKKHKHDLNLFTKTQLADSLTDLSIKRSELTEYNRIVTHPGVNWKTIGDGVADVLGTAVCIAVIGAFVYWVTLQPK